MAPVLALLKPLLGPLFASLFKELIGGFFSWLDARQARADNILLGGTQAANQSSEAARRKEAEYAEIADRPVTRDDILERLRNGTF